jgi:hypothetical protein
MPQPAQLGADGLGRCRHHLGVGVRVLVVEVEVMSPVDWHHVEVDVWHFEPDEHETDSRRLECRHLRGSDDL